MLASKNDPPVAGIVLAAGTSSRMGRNKLLLQIEGESLIRRAVRAAVTARLDPVIVVLGHEAERARSELRDLSCTPVLNPDFALGTNASLRAGVAAIPAASAAAIVMLADMPFVTAEMLAQLVSRYRQGRPPLVISDYAGVNAPPMLYDRALFGELAVAEGEGCGRQVVRRHRAEAQVLQWPATALADLDTPDDFERLNPRRGGA